MSGQIVYVYSDAANSVWLSFWIEHTLDLLFILVLNQYNWLSSIYLAVILYSSNQIQTHVYFNDWFLYSNIF